MKSGRVLLGTSGWSYNEWVGVFYPTASESKLRHYTRVFQTAEIDSTFYAYPQKGMVLGWDRYSPAGFIFNAKIPRTITHERLRDLGEEVEADLDRFAELMEPLNQTGKLGCLLLQLPPSYKYDPNHLESLLSILPHNYKYAVEFRHKTWLRDETWNILSKYNVAYTIVDEPLLPPDVHITADFAYLRWHGHGLKPWYDYHYSEEELEHWIPRVTNIKRDVTTLYGYFNNHFHGYAVENCLHVLEMLGELTPEQDEALNQARAHLGMAKDAPVGLARWTGEDRGRPTLIKTLSALMGESRLARALSIPDREVSVINATEEKVEARIRDYNLVMDMKSKTVVHDCGDWERSLDTKQLCKHVGRVLLALPAELALAWATNVESDLESWSFRKFSD